MAGFQRRAWATGHPSAHPLQARLPACPPASNSFGPGVPSLIRTCDPTIHLQTGHLEQAPIHTLHPSSHPSIHECILSEAAIHGCVPAETYIHTYLGTYIHTRTYVHVCTQIHTPTHTSPCPVNQTNVIMPCSGMQGHPSRPSDQQREQLGFYGLTPVGCLSETSSPCRTAQDPHPQSHAINKGSIKAPAFARPLASRTGSPTHTLKRLGSLAPWSPQSLQRVGQTASAPSAISNLHAAGSHAA